jgi:hypothetical protein
VGGAAQKRRAGQSGELRPTILWVCRDASFLLSVIRALPPSIRIRPYDNVLEGVGDRTLTRCDLFICQGENERRVDRLRVALDQTRQIYGYAPPLVLLDAPHHAVSPEETAKLAVRALHKAIELVEQDSA